MLYNCIFREKLLLYSSIETLDFNNWPPSNLEFLIILGHDTPYFSPFYILYCYPKLMIKKESRWAALHIICL